MDEDFMRSLFGTRDLGIGVTIDLRNDHLFRHSDILGNVFGAMPASSHRRRRRRYPNGPTSKRATVKAARKANLRRMQVSA